jgi:hypothetical protein
MALRTPLYDTHVEAGARIVDFAGWEMPVQYAGILEEHEAVRTRAGLFDVSHMGEVVFRGPRAAEALGGSSPTTSASWSTARPSTAASAAPTAGSSTTSSSTAAAPRTGSSASTPGTVRRTSSGSGPARGPAPR